MEIENNTPCYKCTNRICTVASYLALESDYACKANIDHVSPITGITYYKKCVYVAKNNCPNFNLIEQKQQKLKEVKKEIKEEIKESSKETGFLNKIFKYLFK